MGFGQGPQVLGFGPLHFLHEWAQGPPGQGHAGPDSFEGNYRRTLMLMLL